MMKTSPSNGTIMTQSQTPHSSSKQSTCFDEAIQIAHQKLNEFTPEPEFDPVRSFRIKLFRCRTD